MEEEELAWDVGLALMWTWWDDGRLVFGWTYQGDWIPLNPLWAGSDAWN